MIRAETHLFGSVDGYRTLARAAGVSDAEDAALSAMGFGSPRSGSEFDSLLHRPCMAGRLLASGRFAITRLFPGAPDVAGRQTVERRTLILSSEQWLQACRCDLHATLLAPAAWSRDAFAAGRSIDLDPMPCQDLLPEPTEQDRRAYDALLAAHASGRCAILPDEPRWHQAMLRLAGLLPAGEAISLGWGVGLWNVPPGVWISTLREPGAPRNAFVAPTAGGWRHAEAVQRLGTGLPTRPPWSGQPAAQRKPRVDARLLIVASVATLVVLALVIRSCMGFANPPAPPSLPSQSAKPAEPSSLTTATTAATTDDAAPPAQLAASTAPPTPDPTTITAPTDANPAPASFGSTQQAEPGFGQASAEEPEADAAATPTPASPPIPQVPPQTPPPAPSPAPSPSIPPASDPDSAPWDDATALLDRSIEILGQARSAADATGHDATLARTEAADALLAIALETTSAARQVNAQFRAAKQTAPVLVDLNAGTVPADAATRLADDTASPDLLRQSALLVARFAQMVAALRLDAAAGDMVDPDDPWTRKRNELAKARLTDWPSDAFSRWFVARPDVRKNTARTVAATQVAELIRKAVEGRAGRTILSRALREAAIALQPEPTP
jgi:hypothetical protein